MKVLIDGDVLVYKAGFSAQRTTYRFVYASGSKIDYDGATLIQIKKDLKQRGLNESAGKLQHLIHPDPVEYALQRAKLLVEYIIGETNSSDYQLYLTSTDKSNYRFNLATIKEYKGNRKTMKKPLHYQTIRDYLEKFWNADVIYNQEADDAMGIYQFHNLDSSIIATIDKDLDMIPGYHFNIDTKSQYTAHDPGTLFLDSKRKIHGRGLLWFYAQMLLGDNADNIPGIPGYGPVTVFNTLTNVKDEAIMKEIVKDLYKKCYTTKAVSAFKEVGNLLWIRRNEEEYKVC